MRIIKNVIFVAVILILAGVSAPRVVHAIAGSAGLEFAIDAPWRIEPFKQPTSSGAAKYGPIPITITFHDAIFDDSNLLIKSLPGKIIHDPVHVGYLVDITVTQKGVRKATVITPSRLREIERKKWISELDNEPIHELCYPYKGNDCRDFYNIKHTAAWHAMFWYKPPSRIYPGKNISLRITIRTKYHGGIRSFTNRLVVHAGEAPLPRFSNEWIYGDFHYHSQMTDNEGESAYSYRNVVRTLGSMGMDFVFATDHASNSNQIDGDIKVKKRHLNTNQPLDSDSLPSIPSQHKQWMIGANSSGYIYPKSSWGGPSGRNYNLKGSVTKKFLQSEGQGTFGGINLGWTENASAKTAASTSRWFFSRKSGSNNTPLRYGEPIAIGLGGGKSYIKYASRNMASINLDWSKSPSYEWMILGGRKGDKIRKGKDWVAIFNIKHQQPLIFFQRPPEAGADIGWPDSEALSPITLVEDAYDSSVLRGATKSGTEVRDLTPSRFEMAKKILYGWKGANEDILTDVQMGVIANVSSHNVVPQVYMGEEVDAWPEMSQRERDSGSISYGDGLQYIWANSNNCYTDHSLATRAWDSLTGWNLTGQKEYCRDAYSSKENNVYYVKDQQGLYVGIKGHAISHNDANHSRQHIIYFPYSHSTNTSVGFIGSDTGSFGGAKYPLGNIISKIRGNGVSFLAHPLSNASPGSSGGPAIVPYSHQALRKAWAAPEVLGLQFWNEDIHRKAKVQGVPMGHLDSNGRLHSNLYDFPWPWAKGVKDKTYRVPYPWTWPSKAGDKETVAQFSTLYHGAYTWDMYLRKGLDYSKTRGLRWLAPGEPRKWFMAGGSDSHGDFNFRRVGNVGEDWSWGNSAVIDSAIGKPRNLVFMQQPKARSTTSAKPRKLSRIDRLNKRFMIQAPVQGKVLAPVGGVSNRGGKKLKKYSNTEVIHAISKGRFSVTDGPALRIAIDKNRNGKIDDGDYQMGDSFNIYPGEYIPLLVEWISTPEFGKVNRIDVYVGTKNKTFAYMGKSNAHGLQALRHGPRVNSRLYKHEAKSRFLYTSDPGDVLRIYPGSLKGLSRLYLSPKQYGLLVKRTRFYIRAFAQADGAKCRTGKESGMSCGPRVAFANPIWGKSLTQCKADPHSLDGNNNGMPDICELKLRLPDLCTARGSLRMNKVVGKSCRDYRSHAPVIHTTSGTSSGLVNDRPSIIIDPVRRVPPKKRRFTCNSRDVQVCRRYGASCDVLRAVNGRQNAVCRWSSKRNAKQCKQTVVGIWTSGRSRYARIHPGAVPSRRQGACITEVKNIRKRRNTTVRLRKRVQKRVQ